MSSCDIARPLTCIPFNENRESKSINVQLNVETRFSIAPGKRKNERPSLWILLLRLSLFYGHTFDDFAFSQHWCQSSLRRILPKWSRTNFLAQTFLPQGKNFRGPLEDVSLPATSMQKLSPSRQMEAVAILENRSSKLFVSLRHSPTRFKATTAEVASYVDADVSN